MMVECSQPGCHNEARFTGVWLLAPNRKTQHGASPTGRYGVFERRPVCSPCTEAGKHNAPNRIEALPEVQAEYVKQRKLAAERYAKRVASKANQLPGIEV